MISVIIVSFNTSSLLRTCLGELFANSAEVELEVFVVDNNSSDDSAAMVQKEFPQVTLIANKENLGFAAANNQAWKRASGEFILLLNPALSSNIIEQVSADIFNVIQLILFGIQARSFHQTIIPFYTSDLMSRPGYRTRKVTQSTK